MSLAAGTKLGRYEIRSRLGAGGIWTSHDLNYRYAIFPTLDRLLSLHARVMQT
jgi:hypothetical protein